MKDIHDQSYYELLDVDPSATQDEILKAYNRARATYGHSSPALYSLFNKDEAQELLRLIDEAYAILSNQFKRRQYDSKAPAMPVKQEHAERPPLQNVNHEMHADTHFAIPSAASIPEFSETEKVSSRTTRAEAVAPTPPPPQVEPMPVAEPEPAATPQSIAAGGNLAAKSPGTSPFGTYKIDPAFEEEIKKTEVFSGAMIQKVRLYKNITTDQISELTKISRSYLLAIESNNFSSLPAAVFVRGFIVQIAKILGLDPTKTANSFIVALKEAQKK